MKNNKVLQDKDANAFTEQFIEEEMKKDWGIDKQNQLLFIWHYIHSQITEKALYDEKDGNSKRLEDFNSKAVNIRIKAGGQMYRSKFIAYMNQRSEEADRRSEEAKQSIAISLYHILAGMIKNYQLRNTAFEDEIEMMKKLGERSIQKCNKFNIDYHALLPLEVQRFYDIKPISQQNTLTCEKAIVQLLNITLDEIVKLYNLYQKAPNAEREKYDIKSVIECCQRDNIDYKSKLTPEIRRYFGVE